MALLRNLHATSAERNSLHVETDGGWRTFVVDGRRLLQIDTYGSDERIRAGHVSQSIQLDEARAKQVLDIIRQSFPSIE
ncbi:hypothetical protein [Aeromicrobium sp. CnD17-E]|uniref:hypothetical protein n=1 Tax=Aeromicrobium sp. CnD17-E TaxID=2954487 RepID=UPI002097FFDB|nr:hypothetical protein [Aeromicrobium sp. CnD17-E]MCO7237922.1 hypothetical protein [Aeromicrobium sp. CnD17-E]